MVAKAKNQKSGGRKHSASVRATKVHARKLQPARGASMKSAAPAKEDAEKAQNGFHKPGEFEPAAIVPKAVEEHAAPIERERTSYDGDTAIKLYLREIGQVKLLTPQEEIELAARIKKGDKK